MVNSLILVGAILVIVAIVAAVRYLFLRRQNSRIPESRYTCTICHEDVLIGSGMRAGPHKRGMSFMNCPGSGELVREASRSKPYAA